MDFVPVVSIESRVVSYTLMIGRTNMIIRLYSTYNGNNQTKFFLFFSINGINLLSITSMTLDFKSNESNR